MLKIPWIFLFLFLIGSFALKAQPDTVKENIWQESWKGVPEYYQEPVTRNK